MLHTLRGAALGLLLGAAPASLLAQGEIPSMLGDRREVLITGVGGVAASAAPARVSVYLNGVEFSVLTELESHSDAAAVQSPMRTCRQLADQIASFVVEMRADVEFEAACMPLAGDAALLAVQANPERFPVAGNDEGTPWHATRRRFVDVTTESTDSGQRVKVVR